MLSKPLRQALCLAALLLAGAVAAQGREIVIGQSTALTGPLSTSGEPMRLGAQLCFDAVNAAGGIHGRKIRFISKDDRYQVDETVRNVRGFIDKEEAVALIGGSGTANNEALLDQKILANANIAMVGPRTGGAVVRQPANRHMFHVRASYAQEVDKAIGYFATLHVQKVGIVYQADAFGRDGFAAAQSALQRAGLQPSVVATYERNSTNMQGAVNAVTAQSPQAVLLLTTTASTAEFLRLFRQSGAAAHMMALSVNDTDAIVRLIGAKAAYGLTVTTVFPSPTRTDYPLIKEFQQAIKRFGPANMQASQVSLEGYLAARVLVEALGSAGDGPTRAQVLKSLESMGKKDFGGFWVHFGPDIRVGSAYVDISFVGANGALLR